MLNRNKQCLQTENDYCNRCKAGLLSKHGLHWFSEEPFGLNLDTETFHKTLTVVDYSASWTLLTIYLDDPAVFLNSPQDDIEQVNSIQQLLHRAGVALKFKNFELIAETIDHVRSATWPTGQPLYKTLNRPCPETKAPGGTNGGLCRLDRRNIPRQLVRNIVHCIASLNDSLKDRPTQTVADHLLK